MFLASPTEERIKWTKHSEEKMRYYQFSKKRVLKIIRKPERREEGIAPRTIAAMQIVGTKRKPTEAWTMYTLTNRTLAGKKKTKIIRIISAWRYPGRTPIGERPIIPEDTLEQLKSIK